MQRSLLCVYGLAIYRMKINHFFCPLSFRIDVCASVCIRIFTHILSVCTYIQHHTKVYKCQKETKVTAVHNEHVRVVSTTKPLFSVSSFITSHACGFSQGTRECILVLQHFIICFIKMLTFPTSLGSSVCLIIRDSKIELLQFLCVYVYTSWEIQCLFPLSPLEPYPEWEGSIWADADASVPLRCQTALFASRPLERSHIISWKGGQGELAESTMTSEDSGEIKV